MLRYHDIANKEKDLLAMTGYTQQEFTALLPQFQKSYDDYLTHYTIEGYERVGQIPKPYHNSPLPTIEDKLLFILVCLKQNPSQTLQGYLFGMSQTNVTKWVHLLHTVLNNALAALDVLPNREMIIESDDGTKLPPHDDHIDADDTDDASETDALLIQDHPFFSMMELNDQ
jgi:Helix-turn-helix of DDE superfamily endonuclease